MTKLAFWMATGSGKTILMHFHYRQFLHYNKKPLDNILLVTPDEGLSQQHLENMEAAGIPCARFSLEDSGFEAVSKNTVRVIEITKLVEEKKGSGVSVPVEAFEGNLLFSWTRATVARAAKQTSGSAIAPNSRRQASRSSTAPRSGRRCSRRGMKP